MPPNYSGYISGDPVYAQTKLQARSDLTSSLAQAFERQQQYLMQLGDPNLARQIFRTNSFAQRRIGGKLRHGHQGGKIVNQITGEERNMLRGIREAGNPQVGTSTLAKIGYAYNEAVRAANNQMNNQGLFYSGARARTLGELARGRQFQEQEATFAARQQLNQILDFVMQSRRDYRTRLQAAAESAYNRALAQQIAGA